MEGMWESIKRGLQDGATVAVNKAEALTQVGRARLDIAAAKTRLSRLHGQLGVEVFRRLEAGEAIGDDPSVRDLCDAIRSAAGELQDSETEFAQVQEDLRAEEEAPEADPEAPQAT